MGTTLENGVYLPSEGERNCYAGLKTNWEILDQKVADVTALQQAVAGALHREIVESLPTTDIDPNTIYMVLSGTSATENVYNEYMYVNNAWELIGTSATDLTNYYTKSEVDGKLLLKASASDLTSHTGDATIHVTTADKATWNTVTSKANDSDVVHTSGNETIGGVKTFNDLQIIDYGTQYKGARNAYILPEFSAGYSGLAITTLGFSQALKIGNFVLDSNNKPTLDTSKAYIQIATGESNSINTCILEARNSTNSSLGTSANKWKSVYATNYYYGSDNVEFSTKFVTTDTNQTISGNKTFSSNTFVYNSDTNATTPSLYLKSSKIEISSQGNASGDQNLVYLDKNNTAYAYIKGAIQSNGSAVKIRAIAKDSSDNSVINELQMLAFTNGNKAIIPTYSNEVDLGVSSYKWKSFNGVEPSSLSLPSGNLNDIIDISSYLTYLDGSSANTYIAPANGWISITMGNCSGIQAYITGLWGHQIVRPTVGGVRFFMPICKNMTANILIFGGTVDNARFFPCQGNV